MSQVLNVSGNESDNDNQFKQLTYLSGVALLLEYANNNDDDTPEETTSKKQENRPKINLQKRNRSFDDVDGIDDELDKNVELQRKRYKQKIGLSNDHKHVDCIDDELDQNVVELQRKCYKQKTALSNGQKQEELKTLLLNVMTERGLKELDKKIIDAHRNNTHLSKILYNKKTGRNEIRNYVEISCVDFLDDNDINASKYDLQKILFSFNFEKHLVTNFGRYFHKYRIEHTKIHWISYYIHSTTNDMKIALDYQMITD